MLSEQQEILTESNPRNPRNLQFDPVPADDRSAPIPKVAGASRGLAQTFGLDIRAATLAVLVDLMIFGGDVMSLGGLIVLGAAVAAVLGYITYKIQIRWYRDDHESAVIKALIVGLLTAIPVPLTPLVAVPCGILGVVQRVRRR